MADLHVTLTYRWFDEIRSGRKTAEYRRATSYWREKLKNVRPGGFIVFHRGYSAETIRRKISNVRQISGWDLPHAEYHFFKCPNESYFFEINFEKNI